MCRTDLRKFLAEQGRLSEWEAQRIFKQLADAMLCLHVQDVVHRDLKPANILLTEAGDVKLADFGLARTFDQQDDLMRTKVGTPYYLAPEVLESRPYDEKADLWSAGVILFQLISGRVPFPARTEAELRERV